MQNVAGGEYIDIPDGWGKTSFFGRLLDTNCQYESLVRAPKDGGLTIKQVYDLLRILDWQDYKRMVIAERHGPK